MKGDFTRDTFDANQCFSRVLMQQGRVQLDSDFNEQAAILLHYLRTLAMDLIGPYGGSKGNLGFAISDFAANQSGKNSFTIGKGHYYVNGILCDNYHDPLTYETQEGFQESFEDAPIPPDSDKTYYAYLDVWERHITYVQNDDIRETALGGPDTCTRAQVVWQVKLLEPKGDPKVPEELCSNVNFWLYELHPNLSKVQLKARVRPAPGDANACSIPPESRYRGLENQLYRIEVHRGGTAAANAATFKWSRDNGSVVFPIVQQQGSVFTVQSLGRDQRTSLQVGDWVEIMDDGLELRGEPGILVQVDAVDLVGMTVTLKPPPDGVSISGLNYDYTKESRYYPLLRRWDHCAIEGMAMSQGAILIREGEQGDGWIEIEDGIEVQFQPPAKNADPFAGVYRTGDYWLVPARVATGGIEWPTSYDQAQRCELPTALSPQGIEHHYAPLAKIAKGKAYDCRCAFSLQLNCATPSQEKDQG